MNTKYDPEDIEYLLKTKRFDELYPNEKTFVLQHMEDEREYESMRKTLMLVASAQTSGDAIEPRESIKTNLLAEFDKEKKSRFYVWLNGILAFRTNGLSWYRQPAYQLAFASVVIVVGMFMFINPAEQVIFADSSPTEIEKDENPLSENNETEKKEDPVASKEELEVDVNEDLSKAKESQREISGDSNGIENTNSDESEEVILDFADNNQVTGDKDLEISKYESESEVEKALAFKETDDVATNDYLFDTTTDEVAVEELELRVLSENTDKIASPSVELTNSVQVELTADTFAKFSATTVEPLLLDVINIGAGAVSSSVSAREVENLFDQLFTAL